jgi:hypothetical protein
MSLKDRFASAWNAFTGEHNRIKSEIDNPKQIISEFGSSSYIRQDRTKMRYSNERSILNSIFNRIANDVASVQIQHVRVDDNKRFVENIKSGLNDCITLSANIDQTARDFWIDVVQSMLDEGVIAVVPVDTNTDLNKSSSFDILSLRTGRIVEWMPSFIKIDVYNDRRGKRETVTLPKDKVAILENPFYSIMNEPNSTLKRLIYKMNLLDQIDGQKASSKLNLLIQLPYSLKSPTKQAQAQERRQALEDQLTKSKYGVGYIDSTEKVTQLGHAIENDLPQQIQALTDQLYNQIGLSADVFKGTANAEQMLFYNKKVLKPILDTIELEFTRKFLTPTARTQGQKVAYYLDVFDLVTVDEVANMANAFSRNEILSANEFRAILGFKANDDPRSDQLINKNMPINQVDPSVAGGQGDGSNVDFNGELDELEQMLDNDDYGDEPSKSEKLLEQLQHEIGG